MLNSLSLDQYQNISFMKQKRFFIFALLLVTVSSTMMASDNIKVQKAKLNEATVFFNGAELTHSASSPLIKGENEIKIEGLSPNVDKNSIKIKTSNGVVVSAYEYSVDYLTTSKSDNPGIKKLKDSLDIYNRQLNEIEVKIKANGELKKLLQKGVEKNISGSEKGLAIDELIKTMDYYKAKFQEIESFDVESAKAEDRIEKSIERIENQIDQESTKNTQTSGILRLNLASPIAAVCNFTISYYTTSAGWTPYYDINVASTDKPIKIASKAKVRQTTSFDWEKVKLTLSTATPGNGKTAPLFHTWFLEPVQIQPRPLAATQNSLSYKLQETVPGVRVEKSELKKDKFQIRGTSTLQQNTQPLYIVDGAQVDAHYLESLDPSMIKEVSVLKDASATAVYGSRGANGVMLITTKTMDDYVVQSENDLNLTFDIDLPYTIPGNGKEQSIDLQTKETQAEYKYYCAPKLDTETYLLAEIAGWEKLNLLSGKANVTYDGTYVGETQIDARSTNEKLALTLGSDKRVSVKREKLKDFSSTKFLGNDVKQVFTYRLTVKNNQNKAVKMVLKDQYPVSTLKTVAVEFLTKDTTPFTMNKEDVGVITWEEDFKAGESKTYQISYSVKYPKDMNLNL